MSLPKLDLPLFMVKIPSTGKKINMRPLTVKEEKILLMAQESNSIRQTLLAIKQVINNCIQAPDFDVDTLAMFDVEYMFLQLRARSIDNKITVSYKDSEDGKVYPFEIDLEKITVNVPKKPDFKIKLTAEKTLQLKYPTLQIFEDLSDSPTEQEQSDSISLAVLDKLYDGDEVFEFANYSKKEVQEFIESFPMATFEKIKGFIENIPVVTHTLNYTNANGKDKQIVLKGMDDFFI